MARILEFKPREQTTTNPPTSEEALERLRKRTTDTVRDLVSYYRSTGRWNDSCESAVIAAIKELYIVCAILAGVTYGEQPPSVG